MYNRIVRRPSCTVSYNYKKKKPTIKTRDRGYRSVSVISPKIYPRDTCAHRFGGATIVITRWVFFFFFFRTSGTLRANVWREIYGSVSVFTARDRMTRARYAERANESRFRRDIFFTIFINLFIIIFLLRPCRRVVAPNVLRTATRESSRTADKHVCCTAVVH